MFSEVFGPYSHRYFRKYGPVVGGKRKLWFSFFTDFDALLVLNVNYTFFSERAHKNTKKGVNHHQAIFSDFLYFFLWFSQFSVPADTIFGWLRHTDVTMTSHKIFFCQSHPLRLFYDCAIGFCSTFCSFSGLWVNLPPPNHLTSIESPNHNRVNPWLISSNNCASLKIIDHWRCIEMYWCIYNVYNTDVLSF